MEMIKIDRFLAETQTNNGLTTVKKILVYQSCINLMSFVFILAGSLWSILGVIRFASGLNQKSGPNLQASTWQIVGGFGLVVVSILFRNQSFDYNLLVKIFDYAHRLVFLGGAFWSLNGLIIFAEGLKNTQSPSIESGIWQIVGGMIICFVAVVLLKNIVKVVDIAK